MGTRTAFGIAGAAILLLAAWLVLRTAADGGPPLAPAEPEARVVLTGPLTTMVPAPAPATRSQDPGPQQWLEALSGREDSLVADASDPHAIVLRGRLTVRQRPWLHPANVSVRITRSFLDTVQPSELGAADELAPTHDDPTTATDDEGRFALRFAPAPGGLFFLIDHGGAWADFQRVRDVPHVGGELDLGDIFLDDRGGVTGRVIGSDGRPAVDAVVRAVDEPLLGLASSLGEWRAERMAGVEEFRADGAVAFGPLPAWVARRDTFLPFPTAKTDAKGNFVLTGLRPGQQDILVLTERNGRRRLQAVQVACDRQTDVGIIALQWTNWSTWQFVDEDRKPWVGAQVVAIGETGFGSAPARTNASGRVDLLGTTSAGLAFGYPDGGPWIRVAQGNVDPVVVPRARRTLIELHDDHDQPVAGARVRLFAQGALLRPADRALPTSMQPHATEPGVYEGRVPPGIPLAIVASAPGFAPAIAAGEPGTRHALRMVRLFPVTVRVRDSAGNAIADAVVRIQAHRNPEMTVSGTEWDLLANDRARLGRTDQNGELQVLVWDTFLSFAAEHPLFALGAGPKLRPHPGQTIDLMLRKNGSVHGTLFVHGIPAPPGFRVRARLRPPGAHELATSGWLAEASAASGDGGTFVFASLDAGQWEFEPSPPPTPGKVVAAAASTRYRIGIVSLEEGQDVWFRLEAEPSDLEDPRLCGTIRVDGVQQAGARVRVRRAQPRSTETATQAKERARRRMRSEERAEPVDPAWDQFYTTDAFGTFAFAGLEPATDYEVRIDLPQQDRLQFLRREVVRTPPADDPRPARIDIDVQSGSVTIYATRLGRACANAMLRLRQIDKDGADAACYEVLTDANGQCTVAALPTGTWTLEPVHGGDCSPGEVKIEPGAQPALAVQVVGR